MPASTLYFLDNQALPYLHLIFGQRHFLRVFFTEGEEKRDLVLILDLRLISISISVLGYRICEKCDMNSRVARRKSRRNMVVDSKEELVDRRYDVKINKGEEKNGGNLGSSKKKKKDEEADGRRKYSLLSYGELPEYMKDNEYILNHYRADWPLREAFFSLFRWHNESLNVWTYVFSEFMISIYYTSLIFLVLINFFSEYYLIFGFHFFCFFAGIYLGFYCFWH